MRRWWSRSPKGWSRTSSRPNCRWELECFKIDLKEAVATFRGSPSVTLTGSIAHKDHPDYAEAIFTRLSAWRACASAVVG